MISLDSCLVCDDDKRKYPCHHCGKVVNKTMAMALSFVTVDDGVTHVYKSNSKDEKIVCTVLFCFSCYRELAGRRYMFEGVDD